MRNSLCAVSYENTLELVRFGISKTTISSTVWYYTNGDIFVGAEGSSWDSVTIRFAKRFIGTLINELGELSNLLCGSPLVELDDRYSRLLIRRDDEEEKIGPIDVEAEILREIRSHVDKYVIEGSRKLSTVVVGVPARFNQLQWECTLAACRKVFETPINVKLLDEPVATFIHYFEKIANFEPGYYLVYDFGSGTFDLTLVEYERADSYDIKEIDGDDKLGGIDIDLALLEYVIMRAQVDFNFDLREKIEKNERKKAMLLQRCEKVKMNVVSSGQGAIDITDFIPRENLHAADIDDDDDDEVLIQIDRELLNALIKNAVDRTTSMIDKLLEKYNEEDIKAIILVGGTSSIPYISETLKENIKIYRFVKWSYMHSLLTPTDSRRSIFQFK